MNSLLTLALAAAAIAAPTSRSYPTSHPGHTSKNDSYLVSLGPRPYYIINNMTDGPLKQKLQSCENKPVSINQFSIGHRGGGTLQFPEETRQSEDAGARMGAGVLECDVSFTELAKKCTVPFTPANSTSPADALCCTSDITTAEYSSLCGKQDGFNASARTPQDYQSGTPNWRTELYDTCGKVLTLNEYIDLVNTYPGYRNFTPELKTPPAQVPMPFNGYTQQQYAQDMVDAFRNKSIDYSRIWPQSFTYDDILFWLKYDHAFGKQAIYLVEFDTPADLAAGTANLTAAKAAGVNIIGPPLPMLLSVGGADNKSIVPSPYAHAVKAAGLDIIAWTFERSGPLATVKSRGEYYFESLANITYYDGQYYEVLDVLVSQVGIKGLFSDWSSTVTYFANCFGLTGPVGGSYN